MNDEAAITLKNEPPARSQARRSVEVRVPASTSNLGAGFDCFGLALQLYLTVRATIRHGSQEPCRIRASRGESRALLPRTADNLIYRAMRHAAEREGVTVPPVRLAIHNEIPLGRGLGSSAAAVIAGITLCSLLSRQEIPRERVLRYARELEGHPDNVAASLYGGWVITCEKEDGNVLAIKRRWPAEIKIVAVSPNMPVKTARARAALPRTVKREDAVHNIQRTALFIAAMERGLYDLLWEAMRDRLHQERRQSLVPGLMEALAMPRLRGLVGLALSGAGPSILALAQNSFDEIGERIGQCFHQHGIETTVRLLDVDHVGATAEDRKS